MIMARRESGKVAVWRERLRRFRASGMTVARFCQLERVSLASFYQWRRKLESRKGALEKARPAFQQVVVTPAVVSPGLRVRLASGAEIEVAAGNLDVIRAVVGELVRAEYEFAAEEDAAC
jgi:transposase-like protein